MDVDALRSKLAELQQADSQCGLSSSKLEARPAYLMLVNLESSAAGKTKREVLPVFAAYREVSAVYGLVATSLKQAEDLLAARFIMGGKHEQIEALLLGPSIKLSTGGVSPQRFLEMFSTAINNLDQIADRCNKVVLELDAEIAAADVEATRLEQLATSHKLPVPSEVGVARNSAHNLKEKSKTDPFGAFDDISVEVTPLLQIADQHLQAATIKTDHVWTDLATSLNEFRKTAQQSSATESQQAAAAYEAARQSLEARTNSQETEQLIAAYAMVAFQ
jgi:hypothetical protein